MRCTRTGAVPRTHAGIEVFSLPRPPHPLTRPHLPPRRTRPTRPAPPRAPKRAASQRHLVTDRTAPGGASVRPGGPLADRRLRRAAGRTTARQAGVVARDAGRGGVGRTPPRRTAQGRAARVRGTAGAAPPVRAGPTVPAARPVRGAGAAALPAHVRDDLVRHDAHSVCDAGRAAITAEARPLVQPGDTARRAVGARGRPAARRGGRRGARRPRAAAPRTRRRRGAARPRASELCSHQYENDASHEHISTLSRNHNVRSAF